MLIYWLLIIFVIVFPKSGIKVGPVPLTTGYGIILVAGLLALVDNLLRPRSNIDGLTNLALCAPFGTLVALSLTINGGVDSGAVLAAITSFVVLPVIFFGLLSSQLASVPWSTVHRSIIIAVRIVAIYGLSLFVIKLVTGSFVEIPYLTVNADDAGLLETTKHIDRGGIFKLISTYNNGNLFGASMLLLLPLYVWLERRIIFKIIVVAALVLTLSRAVWLAFLFSCALMMLHRRMTSGLLILLVFSLALLALVLWLLAGVVGNGAAFLIDPTLGGRNSTLGGMTSFSLLPSEPMAMLPEIVYAGVIQQLGILGLLSFVLFLFSAIWVARRGRPQLLPLQKHAALGIYSYAFICSGDGGIMLIPVIPIFLFVSMIIIEAPRLVLAPRVEKLCREVRSGQPIRI